VNLGKPSNVLPICGTGEIVRTHDEVRSRATSAPDFGFLSRRSLLLGSAAVLGSAALAACASPGASRGAAQIKFWHLLSGGDGINMTRMLAQANEANPTFRATSTTLAWGTPYYTKLAMAAAGGRAADLAVMHASRLAGFAPGGLLDPWDLDLLEEFGVTSTDFPERVWEKGIFDDQQFAVALDAHPFILLYNKEIADQAGILNDGKLPEMNDPEAFFEMGRALQEVTGKHGISYGYLGDGSQMFRLWYTMYRQHDAELELPIGGEVAIDKAAAVESLQFMQQLLDDTITAKGGDYATGVAEFAGGASGAFLSGVWELPNFVETLDIGAMPIPTLFGTPAAYADSHVFTLPHQDHPDETKRREVHRLVAELLKSSFQWAEAGHIPTYTPVTESAEYAELQPQADYVEAAEILNYDPEAWFTGAGSDFHVYFAENIQGALLGGSDAEAAVTGFEQRINKILAKPSPV
jgi:multiple sugar transport system substrate-binding protein